MIVLSPLEPTLSNSIAFQAGHYSVLHRPMALVPTYPRWVGSAGYTPGCRVVVALNSPLCLRLGLTLSPLLSLSLRLDLVLNPLLSWVSGVVSSESNVAAGVRCSIAIPGAPC